MKATMLGSSVKTGVRTGQRRSYRCKICAHVSFVVATGRSFNAKVLNIREQGNDDVLLDLGPQMFVTEEVHCKEKNIACRLSVS